MYSLELMLIYFSKVLRFQLFCLKMTKLNLFLTLKIENIVSEQSD